MFFPRQDVGIDADVRHMHACVLSEGDHDCQSGVRESCQRYEDMYQRVSNFIVEIKHNKAYKTYKNMILFLTRIDDEDSSQDPTRFWITESEGRVCNPCPVY